MPNKNIIMVTNLHHSNHLHNSNQANKVITSSTKNNSNEPAHLIWYLSQFQEIEAHVSLCKWVDSPKPLLPAYTYYRRRSELRQLAPLRQQ